MRKTALIIVDFQKEWINKKSKYYVGNIGEEIGKTNLLAESCRSKGYDIIFTKHVEKSGDAFRLKKGAELISGIHNSETDIIIEKNNISSFYNTTLEQILKTNRIKEVVVCGILTNLCVRMLVEELYDRNLKITVIRDCCKALDKKTHEFTLRDLEETREEIKIIDWKEFVYSK